MSAVEQVRLVKVVEVRVDQRPLRRDSPLGIVKE